MFFTFDLCLLLYVIRLAGWLKDFNLSLSLAAGKAHAKFGLLLLGHELESTGTNRKYSSSNTTAPLRAQQCNISHCDNHKIPCSM